MLQLKSFTFNPFQENTYLLYDELKQAIIIDPGMYDDAERSEFFNFIEQNSLTPIMLLNTHAHLDHIFGNAIVVEKYKISFGLHEGEIPMLTHAEKAAAMYGVQIIPSPLPSFFISEKETIQLGKHTLQLFDTPGHSPASVSIYNAESNILISGDILFKNSIGRTDLPGGDYDTLIKSVRNKLFTLPAQTKVYSGHGPATSIGEEINNNPFFK
jgi:glyoxylase-like metal-dependent hydrolase (beta-lactamase superfamily II)